MELAGRIEIPLRQTASHHLRRELAAFQLAKQNWAKQESHEL